MRTRVEDKILAINVKGIEGERIEEASVSAIDPHGTHYDAQRIASQFGVRWQAQVKCVGHYTLSIVTEGYKPLSKRFVVNGKRRLFNILAVMEKI